MGRRMGGAGARIPQHRRQPRAHSRRDGHQGHVRRRCRRRRGERGIEGSHRVPQGPDAHPAPRRPDAEGHSAARCAGNRQDVARARGIGRSRRAVFRHQRFRVHRDVRRCRRSARARAVRTGARKSAVHRVHRRTRRHRRGARHRTALWRTRRTRTDAESTVDRDGRFRSVERRRRDGRDESPGDSRQGAAARRPLRSPDRRRQTRPRSARRDTRVACAQDRARGRRRPARHRAAYAGVCRRGSREHHERSGHSRRSQEPRSRSR